MHLNDLTHDNRGFTLIEAMLCILVVSVGLLAVSKMQIGSMKGNRYALNSTEATLIQAGATEKLMSMSYTKAAELNIADGVVQTFSEVGPFTTTYTITTLPLYKSDETYKRIVLSTTWTASDGVPHAVTKTISMINDRF
jgi:prepilin-type N-terminal cleavage/methylation domain-containing protein